MSSLRDTVDIELRAADVFLGVALALTLQDCSNLRVLAEGRFLRGVRATRLLHLFAGRGHCVLDLFFRWWWKTRVVYLLSRQHSAAQNSLHFLTTQWPSASLLSPRLSPSSPALWRIRKPLASTIDSSKAFSFINVCLFAAHHAVLLQPFLQLFARSNFPGVHLPPTATCRSRSATTAFIFFFLFSGPRIQELPRIQ